jgi:hypothetical protein
MSSVLKYMRSFQPQSASSSLHWGRAAVDGAPFRGVPSLMRDEEFEARTIRVSDAKVQMFDLSKPEHLATYQTILDRAANGWYRIIHVDRTWAPEKTHMMVYVEWAEQYIEDVRGPGGMEAVR